MSNESHARAGSVRLQTASARRRGRLARGIIGRAVQMALEPLEPRMLLSFTLTGMPSWQAEGPGPITGAQAVVPGGHVTGAVQSIAIDPRSDDTVYVGTVGGGIWKTVNAKVSPPGMPTWQPLTDDLPSMTISAIVVNPDPSKADQLFATTGHVSNSNTPGELLGLLRSDNAGADWSVVSTPFGGQNVKAISFAKDTAGRDILVVGTAEGLFISDHTFTFTEAATGLPAGPIDVTDVETDTVTPTRLFAGIAGHGVFRSDNAGATWGSFSDTLDALPGLGPVADTTDSIRILLSMSDASRAGEGPALYAAMTTDSIQISLTAASLTTQIQTLPSMAQYLEADDSISVGGEPAEVQTVNYATGVVTLKGALTNTYGPGTLVDVSLSGSRLTAVYRSGDRGVHWTLMQLPGNTDGGITPGAQAEKNLALLADPNNAEVVYISGDRVPQLPGTVGAVTWNGIVFRGNAAAAIGSQWTAVINNGANATAPHADSRALVFDSTGDLLEGDDGGIYRLVTPGAAGRNWRSMNGNLALTEFYSVAWDEINDRAIGGAQDNGSSVQLPFSGGTPTWTRVAGGDGGTVAAVNGKLGFSSQELAGFTYAGAARSLLVANSAAVAANFVPLTTFDSPPFTTVWEANQAPGADGRLLIGTTRLYESTDNGNNVRLARGGIVVNSDGSRTANARSDIGTVTAMVYGGRELNAAGAIVPRPEIGYVGTDGGSGTTQRYFYARRPGQSEFLAITSYPGSSSVVAIAADPVDWQHVWVADQLGAIYEGRWVVRDGKNVMEWQPPMVVNEGHLLVGLPENSTLRPQSLAVIRRTAGEDPVLVIAGGGGVYRKAGGGELVRLGAGLPNALATDLDYDFVDDVLLVGTLGRGAFSMINANTRVRGIPTLSIVGTSSAETIELQRSPSKPWLVEAFLYPVGGTKPAAPIGQAPLSSLESIFIDAGDGNDVIIINSSNGSITVPDGIHVDGNAGDDRLVSESGTATVVSTSKDHSTLAEPGNPDTQPHIIVVGDPLGRFAPQFTEWQSIELPGDITLASADLDAIGGSLRTASAALQTRGALAMSGLSIGPVDATSLFEGLNGVQRSRLRPKELFFLDEVTIAGPGPVQLNNATSLLRRLFEEGAGGFKLVDIGQVITSPGELATRLDGLDAFAGNVTLDAATDQDGDGAADLQFDVRIRKPLTGIMTLAGLSGVSGKLGGIAVGGGVDFTVDVDMHLIFGVDGNGFYIRSDTAGDEIKLSNLQLSGRVDASARVGFLDLSVSNASLTVDSGATIGIDLLDSGQDASDNLIRLTELLPDSAADLIALHLGADPNDGQDDVRFQADFAVKAVLPGFAAPITLASSQLAMGWPNLATPDAATLAGLGGAANAVIEFMDLAGPEVFEQLAQFRTQLDTIFSSSALDFELPFAPGTTLRDVVNAGEAFTKSIIEPLESEPGSGEGDFQSLQEMLDRLAPGLALDLSDPNLVLFNQNTGELSFRLPVSYAFDPLTRQIQRIDANGLQVDPIDLELQSTLNFTLEFGFNLQSSDPLGSFFVKLASLSADVEAAATDIALHGTAPGLTFDLLEGGLVLNAGVELSLNDPSPNDGRLTPGDLQVIASNPAAHAQAVLDAEIAAAAASASARVGTAASGVDLQNGSLGFVLFTHLDSAAPTQQAPTFAVQAGGDLALVGFGNTVTLSGTGTVRVNNTGEAVLRTDLAGTPVDLDLPAGLFPGSFIADATLGFPAINVTVGGTLTATLQSSGTTLRLDDFSAQLGTSTVLSGTGAVLDTTPAAQNGTAPMLTVQAAQLDMLLLDKPITAAIQNMQLFKDGTFTVGSVSVAGDLLSTIGLAGILPLQITQLSLGAVAAGERIALNRFAVGAAGTFDYAMFDSLPADPVIHLGGISITPENPAFNLRFVFDQGSLGLDVGDGPVALGFENMDFGAINFQEALVTFGTLTGGQFTTGPVGLDLSFDVGGQNFTVAGTGQLSTVGENRVLSVSAEIGASLNAQVAQLSVAVQNLTAQFDFELAVRPDFTVDNASLDLTDASVGEVNVRFGPPSKPFILFRATNASVNLRNDDETFISFGTLTASSPALSDFAGFSNLEGTVSNFAIDRNLNPVLLPGFGVEFTNLPTKQALGLPDWFPIQLNGLGLELGPQALAGNPLDITFILDAQLSGVDAFPITADVRGLAVNVGRLAAGELLGALEIREALRFGIAPFELGDALTIGGEIGFGVVDFDGKKALYGTVSGTFEISGIGGGVSLIMTEFGPLMARVEAPLGIPLGPTGLLLQDVGGGFRFGGDPITRSADVHELLNNPLLFNPIEFDDSAIQAELIDLLRTNEQRRANAQSPIFTFNLPFTMALDGTFTTVATPGILEGTITLGANVAGLGSGQQNITLFGSGDVGIYGIPIGQIGAVLDLTVPHEPAFQLAFAVPAPNSPFGFVVPARTEFTVDISTDGMVEAPLVGLVAFAERLSQGSLVALRDALAAAIDAQRSRPLARLLLEGQPPDVTIDGAFVQSRLLDLLPNVADLTGAAAPPNLEQLARLGTTIVSEILTIAGSMPASQRQQLFDTLASVLADATLTAIEAGWDRFNPKFDASAVIQPVLLGLPVGSPEQGRLIIDKGGIQVTVNGSIGRTLQRLADSGFPFGGSILQALTLGLQDQVMFTFGLSLGDDFLPGLLGGGPGPSVGLDADWTLGIGGTLNWLGFPMANVLGFSFRPGSPRIIDNVQPLFGPNANDPINPNRVPIDSNARLLAIQRLGGLIGTSRLLVPQLLQDPVALLAGIDFSPLLNISTYPGSVQTIVNQLTAPGELARVQLYIPSFENLLDVDLTGGVTSNLSALQGNLQELLDNAYFSGFFDGKFLGIQIADATVDATAQGIVIHAAIPWLGAQADFELRHTDIDMAEMVESLARAAGVNVDLSNVALPNRTVSIPTARGELQISANAAANFLADTLGLPRNLFFPTNNVNAGVVLYTPAFADPSDLTKPEIQRNGGVQFDASLNIPGFIRNAQAHFEMPLFDGNVVPDFDASLHIDEFALPGLPGILDNIARIDFDATLSKRTTTQGAQNVNMNLDGSITLLDQLVLSGGGNLAVNTGANPGIVGGLNLAVTSGQLGAGVFSLDGDFSLEVNTTRQEQGNIPAGPYVGVHFDGSLDIFNLLQLTGEFDFTATDQGLLGRGTATLGSSLLGLDSPEPVSFEILLRADGRIEGSFDGAGISIRLDRFGNISGGIFVDGEFIAIPLPLGDQHVFVDEHRFKETDANRVRNIIIHLSRPAERDMDLTYTITRGSTQPADFTATLVSTQLIPAGATQLIVPITVTGDLILEGDEVFNIHIDSAVYRGIFPPVVLIDSRDVDADITIDDDEDDPRPDVNVTITPTALSGAARNGQTITASLAEGASGQLTIQAQGLGDDDSVELHYEILPTPRTLRTATFGEDFFTGIGPIRGRTGTILLIGNTPQTINLNIPADSRYELNELAQLRFRIARQSLLAPQTTLDTDAIDFTIVNDDQDVPPGTLVFYDLDDFVPGHVYEPAAQVFDSRVVADDLHHRDDASSNGVPGGNAALRFRGGTDHALAIPGTRPLPAGPITVDFWINPDAITTRQTLLDLGNGGLRLVLTNNVLTYQMIMNHGATFTGTLGTLTPGTWQHVAFSYNGTAATATSGGSVVDGYINGRRTGGGSAGGAVRVGGTFMLGATALLRESYSGMIDELRIWSVAQSATTAASLRTLATNGNETALVINHRFDNATGIVATDLIPNGWNLRLGSTLSSPQNILGRFGQPEWASASDSPVAQLARYDDVSAGTPGVPKVPPVNPTVDPGFAISALDWADAATPLEDAPYYRFRVGLNVPVDSDIRAILLAMAAIRFDGIDFFHKAAADGPQRWELRSSADNFETVLADGITDPGSDYLHPRILFDKSIRAHPSSPIEFRLYGLDASGAGSWDVDNLAIIAGIEGAGVFNRPPFGLTGTLPVSAGGVASLDLRNLIRDPDLDDINVTNAIVPFGAGSVSLANNVLTYQPSTTTGPQVPITLTVMDRWGATAQFTVNARVLGDAIDDAFSLSEDSSLNGSVRTNDRLPVDSVAYGAITTLPPGLTFRTDGTFTYTPPANFSGTVQFSYLVSGTGWSDTALASFTVANINDVPAALPRQFTVNEDGLLSVAAPGLLNDIKDVDGDAITPVVITSPARGILSVSASGAFSYQPVANDDTSVTFTYAVSDGKGTSAPATVTIDLLPVNDAPIAGADAFSVESGQTLLVAAPGLLQNDKDIDSARLTVLLPLAVPPANGSIAVSSDGSLKYASNPGFSGTDSFEYLVSDGSLTSRALVRITVIAANRPPIATGDTLTTNEDTALNFNQSQLLANDSDPEGAPLTFTILSQPRFGALKVGSAGALSYVPGGNFNGTDQFSYQITDSKGLTASAGVTINVLSVNDRPIARNDGTFVTPTSGTRTKTVSATEGLLLNDEDPDRDAVFAVLVRGPLSGRLTIFNTDGSFTYVPNTGYAGPDSFTYQVRDRATGGLLSDVVVVNLQAASLSSPPTTGTPVFTSTSGGTIGLDANFNRGWDFTDTNNNGRRDEGESFEPVGPISRTGDGSVFIASSFDLDGNGRIDPSEGQLLGFNGVFRTTLLPMTVPLTAPASSNVVNALTSLVSALTTEQALTVDDAVARIRLAFDLPALDPLQIDPLNATLAGTPGARQLLLANTALLNGYVQSGLYLAAATGLPVAQTAWQVLSALARDLSASPQAINLADPAQWTSLMQSALTLLNHPAPPTLDTAAALIAATNARLLTIGNLPVDAWLDQLHRIETLAQGVAARALIDLAAGRANPVDLLARFTGESLESLLAATTPGVSTLHPEIGARIQRLSITQTTEGGAVEFNAILDGIPHKSNAVVRIAWGDGTVEDIPLDRKQTLLRASHTYGDDHFPRTSSDPATVVALLLVDGRGADLRFTQTTIANVAPQATQLRYTSTIVAGGTLQLSGVVSDSGGDAIQTEIHWGDGQVTQLALASGEPFATAHVYAGAGAYQIRLVLQDDDGGLSESLLPLTVGEAAPPVVRQVQIDDGGAQRSMVRTLRVTFDQAVQIDAGSLVLERAAGSHGPAERYTVFAVNSSGDNLTWDLSFAGSDMLGGSLPDGHYRLLIPAGAVLGSSGLAMATDHTLEFHRLFGDANGDGTLSRDETHDLTKAKGSRLGSSRYVDYLDRNGDGVIDKDDKPQ